MRGPPIIIVPSSQRMEKYILQAFLLLCNTRGLSCSACFFAGVAPLLLFACAALIGSGVWGLKTNLEYAQDPQKAEKHLLIQYSTIALINSFAAPFLDRWSSTPAGSSKSNRISTRERWQYGRGPTCIASLSQVGIKLAVFEGLMVGAFVVKVGSPSAPVSTSGRVSVLLPGSFVDE